MHNGKIKKVISVNNVQQISELRSEFFVVEHVPTPCGIILNTVRGSLLKSKKSI